MEHLATALTSIQQQVVDALAAGASFSAAAQTHRINRVTIYRWVKTIPQFAAAIEFQRAESALARREQLQLLDSRAIDALLGILVNPKSSPSVLLRAAKFVLERKQSSKAAWCMTGPDPASAGDAIPDSSAFHPQPTPGAAVPSQPEATVPEPHSAPASESAPATPQCNTMQHKSGFSRHAEPAPSAASRPAPQSPSLPGSHDPGRDKLEAEMAEIAIESEQIERDEALKNRSMAERAA